MTLGYDPARIRRLAHLVAAAIDDLDAIRTDDRLAERAVDAVRRARRHLELDWVPLLDGIVTSTAMSEWWRRHGDLGDLGLPWITAASRRVETHPHLYESLSDDALLRMVYMDGLQYASGPGWSGPDFDDPYWATLPELAAELAERALDPQLAERMIADAHLLPLLAMAIPLADFDPDFVADLTIALLTGPPIDSGITHRLHGHALTTVMTHLAATSAGGVADVLTDRQALTTLTSWDRLDEALVRKVFRVGLYDAVVSGERSVDEGIEIISLLVDLTNGPLESGMHPGAARGIADSMFGYVHTIAHGIRHFDDGSPVFATDERGDAGRLLGTVADMRDLFGSVMRDTEARSTLATVLGAYIDETVQRLGPDLTTSTAADDPVNFGLLLDAAIQEERIEVEVAATADRARRQRLGATIGFGLGVGLGVLGVPSLVGSIAKEVATRHTPRTTRRAETIGRRLGPTAHDGLLLSVLDDALQHPDRRRRYGLEGLAEHEWEGLRGHLAAIGGADDEVDRRRAVHDLANHVEQRLPDVGRLIVEVSSMAGMDDLRLGGAPVDAD